MGARFFFCMTGAIFIYSYKTQSRKSDELVCSICTESGARGIHGKCASAQSSDTSKALELYNDCVQFIEGNSLDMHDASEGKRKRWSLVYCGTPLPTPPVAYLKGGGGRGADCPPPPPPHTTKKGGGTARRKEKRRGKGGKEGKRRKKKMFPWDKFQRERKKRRNWSMPLHKLPLIMAFNVQENAVFIHEFSKSPYRGRRDTPRFARSDLVASLHRLPPWRGMPGTPLYPHLQVAPMQTTYPEYPIMYFLIVPFCSGHIVWYQISIIVFFLYDHDVMHTYTVCGPYIIWTT